MNVLKLNIGKSSDNLTHVPIGQEYYLFVGIGEKRYYFSNKKKADKFLTQYTRSLNKLIDECSFYHSQAYELFVQSLRYLHPIDVKNLQDKFNLLVDSFLLLSKEHESNSGFFIHVSNFTSTLLDLLKCFKNFYKKHSRLSHLNKKAIYLLRQFTFSVNVIEELVLKYKPHLTKIKPAKLPAVTVGLFNQLKVVV